MMTTTTTRAGHRATQVNKATRFGLIPFAHSLRSGHTQIVYHRPSGQAATPADAGLDLTTYVNTERKESAALADRRRRNGSNGL